MLRHRHTNPLTPIAAGLLLALASTCATAANSNDRNQQSNDAYREGQLVATYVINPALQSYHIGSEVHGDSVTLTGTVDSTIERRLAIGIAQGIRGVDAVHADSLRVSRDLAMTSAQSN